MFQEGRLLLQRVRAGLRGAVRLGASRRCSTRTRSMPANVLFDAIEQVAVVADDGSLSIPRTALRDAVFATLGYEGLTRTTTCNGRATVRPTSPSASSGRPNWPVDGGEGDGQAVYSDKVARLRALVIHERDSDEEPRAGRDAARPWHFHPSKRQAWGSPTPPSRRRGSAASRRSRGGASSSSCSAPRSRRRGRRRLSDPHA